MFSRIIKYYKTTNTLKKITDASIGIVCISVASIPMPIFCAFYAGALGTLVDRTVRDERGWVEKRSSGEKINTKNYTKFENHLSGIAVLPWLTLLGPLNLYYTIPYFIQLHYYFVLHVFQKTFYK